MSRSGELCPRCGDEIEADASARRGRADEAGIRDPDSVLCDGCYFETFDLVDAPERIDVRVCSRCGAVHRGNRWVDVGAEDYTDIAVEEVSDALGVHLDATDVSWEVAPEQLDENNIRMHCQFSGVVRGTLVSEAVVVPVKIARQTCTTAA
jgi:nonsense-mediated mRNA decay protein 3